MTTKQHISLFAQGIITWSVFWVLGLPNYYQQYSTTAIGIGCVFLSVVFSLIAILILQYGKPESRLKRAM